MGTREDGAKPEARLGFGDGLREDCLDGIPNLVLLLVAILVDDPPDVVRLCDDGKLIMLLWMIGEGPRNPVISGVPSLLGRLGLRKPAVDNGWSAKWASSGGACTFSLSSVGCDGRRGPLAIPLFPTSRCR